MKKANGKLRKRILSIFLSGMLLLLTACTNGPGGQENKEVADKGGSEPIELIWWTYSPDGTVPADHKAVLEKANAISKEKIGVTVNIVYKSTEQFELDLNTGEYYDMIFTCDWANDFDSNAGNGYYYDITDLVQSETPKLYDAVDPWWEIGTLHDRIYGVPMLKDLGAEVFFRLNSDYFEKEKGCTLPEEMSFADIEPYLQMWKEDHPNEYPFTVVASGLRGLNRVHEGIVGEYLVIPYSKAGTAEGTEIIPVWEDEEYMDILRNMRKWYLKGYINPDAATAKEVPYSLRTPVRIGTAWTGYRGWSDPDTVGFNVKLVRFLGPNLSRSTEQGSLIAVNAAADEEHAKACLKYMELLYTDRELRDTLAYGIEGTHFRYYEDTVIRIDGNSDGYLIDLFRTGPAVSATVLSGGENNLADPDEWKKVYEGYESANISDTKGFSFDPVNVEAEIAAMDAVWENYFAELITGTVDPDEAMKEMKKQMEDIGIDKVRKEAQTQLDEYLKSR